MHKCWLLLTNVRVCSLGQRSRMGQIWMNSCDWIHNQQFWGENTTVIFKGSNNRFRSNGKKEEHRIALERATFLEVISLKAILLSVQELLQPAPPKQ